MIVVNIMATKLMYKNNDGLVVAVLVVVDVGREDSQNGVLNHAIPLITRE